jgi:hypothetical protein
MKKSWIIFALVILVATQLTVLSLFYPTATRTYADEPVTVVISKLNSTSLRVEVGIDSLESNVVLLFSNGTQKEVPAFSRYTFSVVMPKSGLYIGSYGFQSEGINLSDNQPVDVEFLSNCTLTQTPYSNTNWINQDYPRISVYCFTVQGNAIISVEGMGAGF